MGTQGSPSRSASPRRRGAVALILGAGLAVVSCDVGEFEPPWGAGSGSGGAGGGEAAAGGGIGGAPPVDSGVNVDGGPAAPDPPLPDNDYCRPVSAAGAGQATLEQQILELTNAARAQGATCDGKAYPPVPALTMNPALRCAARAHSQDMIDRKFFDHTNPGGEGPSQRVAKTGFVARSWGENIAAGNATAAQTMQQWLTSAGHCQNLMNGGYRQIGVGYRPGGSYRHYWTQVFGTAR
jgi:uncharacterized protein YkwD